MVKYPVRIMPGACFEMQLVQIYLHPILELLKTYVAQSFHLPIIKTQNKHDIHAHQYKHLYDPNCILS